MDAIRALFLLSVLGLVGCVSASQPTMMWMRMDGQRSSGNPVLEKQFYAAKYQCQLQTQQAVNSSAPGQSVSIQQTQTVNINQNQSPNIALQAGQSVAPIDYGRDMQIYNQNHASDSLLQSCMNAQGYRWGVPPTQ